jgi:hypothetical protein
MVFTFPGGGSSPLDFAVAAGLASSGFIREVAICVELFPRVRDHDLGLVQRVQVEKNEALAEMVLSAGLVGMSPGKVMLMPLAMAAMFFRTGMSSISIPKSIQKAGL